MSSTSILDRYEIAQLQKLYSAGRIYTHADSTLG
jgi:hypothetical protein